MCYSGKSFNKKDQYNKLVDKALVLWKRYGEIYRTLPAEYEAKLEEAQAVTHVALAPLRNIDKETYPDIEFLKKTTEEEAEDYLMDLTEDRLILLIEEIESMPKTNAAFKGMRNKVRDYTFLIEKAKKTT